MSFVDELNKMAPSAAPKSEEEKELERMLESIHERLKAQCTAQRIMRRINGYIIRVAGDSEWGEPDFLDCYSQLYKYNYPYKIILDLVCFRDWRKSKRIVLQLAGGEDNYGSRQKKAIHQDRNFCEKLISRLHILLKNDGFTMIELKTIPVYAAEVKQYYKSSLLTATYYEEGKLTNQCFGYVIQYDIRW